MNSQTELAIIQNKIPELIIEVKDNQYYWHYRCISSEKGFDYVIQVLADFAASQCDILDGLIDPYDL